MRLWYLLADNLTERCEKQMQIKLSLSSALREHIVSTYSDDKMGARPLKRAIQNVVEDKLAEEILEGRILRGDKVSAGYREGKVTFTTKILCRKTVQFVLYCSYKLSGGNTDGSSSRIAPQ